MKSESSDMEYLGTTPNMMGQVEEEQTAVESEKSNVIPPIDYIALAHSPELSGSHSAIESHKLQAPLQKERCRRV